MNIVLLGSQHGNELLGEDLYAYIKTARPELLPHVTYKVANPVAKKHGVRYVESDLNRSYGSKKATYEARRAQQLLRLFRQKAPTLVLDLHTTACVQPPCFIVADSSRNGRFLRASSIVTLVEIKHEIVGSSLIGHLPQAVSIEINQNEARNPEVLEGLCDDIVRYIKNETHTRTKKLYIVEALLKKTEISAAEAATLQNFTRCLQGFYPVLVGENSYKKQTAYLGFKAANVAIIEV
jgi:succinylglutamate desuccinylase